MCSQLRSLLATTVVLGIAGAAPLSAQGPLEGSVRDRALLSRAESLLAWANAKDSTLLVARRVAWRARLAVSGGLVLVVPSVVSSDHALRALDSARSLLREFGGIPESFPRSLVIYSFRALDTGAVLASRMLRARTRVQVSLMQDTGGSWTVNGWDVAASVMQAYRASLDGDWRTWLPADFGLGGWERSSAWQAYRELTEAPWSVGVRCVSGEPAGCRLWLGIDRDSAPYTTRYSAAELRTHFSSGSREWRAARADRGVACLHGEDAACVEYAIQIQQPRPFPAFDVGRRSMLRAVHALHGPTAVARVLADSVGSVGDRLARAAGINEDSLVREWRYWVLTRGGRPRERSFAAEAAPVLLAAGLLLFAATRSRG
jgi:hypothetical protein